MKYFIDKFNKQFLEMLKTEQEPEWHAEGNVAIHTEMVLQALETLDEYQRLPDNEKLILRYACFFHDVGKYKTTTLENGQIKSPGHSKLGEKITREILYFENYDFYFRESVAMLVRYHGHPVHFYKSHEKEAAILACKVNTKHLYILAKADLIGRITNQDSVENTLLNIEYFKEISEKLSCFGVKKDFLSNSQRLGYFKNGNMFKPFDEKRSTVYLMSGVPGSGKDYYINKNLSHFAVISLDNMRRELKIKHGDKKGQGQIIQKAKQMAKEFLAKDIDFVWNATNTTRAMRDQLIGLFKSYGAVVNIIYIEVPFKELLKQNADREYPVKKDVILNLFKTIDIPAIDEADEVYFKIKEEI